MVFVSGGVSVGPHDHVKAALRELGVEERFWGVRLRPGKPTWFGTRGGTLRLRPAGQPGVGDGDLPAVRAPALAALQGADPDGRARDRGARPGRSRATRDARAGRARAADGRATGWRADAHRRRRARTCSPRCSAPTALALIPARRGRAGRRRARRGGAPVRPRRPAPAARAPPPRASARVTIMHAARPATAPTAASAARRSPRSRCPAPSSTGSGSPEYLERLGAHLLALPHPRLARPAAGALHATDSREVVLLTRPFVLLRFRTPEYEIDGRTAAP